MIQIAAAQFTEFFRGVNGVAPFPWQQRLAQKVLAERKWPDVLALPTGSGKTAVLDIALFCLAAAPDAFPRRIVLVIDRRVVVDQGADRADRIAAALLAASRGVVADIASNLRAMWGGKAGESPFETAVLRGGMPRDDAWAKRPDRPVVAVSTVDQVGSRLLFRGYGVSSRMSSVHAGLLGHDTLFILDEVHLSVPFAETLLGLRERWRGFHGNLLPDRWGVVRMSATPGLAQAQDTHFGVNDAAWADDELDPKLSLRIQAVKMAKLRIVKVTGQIEQEKGAAVAICCADEAKKLVKPGVRTIGVIVNRVAVAREIAEKLRADSGITVQLLTGRMRSIDRDSCLKNLLPLVEAGRPRMPDARPLFVVATQCIEAGADFDFDALVTECASLDALRQRFGRLDRLGHLKQTIAVVVARSDQIADASDADPIYGEALRATWRWLGPVDSVVDFGVAAMDQRIRSADLSTMLAPHPHAPILLPSHLDALCQTHPRPLPDPDIPLWLHGPQRGEPEVQLIWRADISAADLLLDSVEVLDLIRSKLAACPPAAVEALSLPIHAVRRWLAEEGEQFLADVPASLVDVEEEEPAPNVRRAVYWNGDDSSVVGYQDIKPGMTLVIPSEYGGIDNDNWAPGATSQPVSDHGDLAQWKARGRATLRLDARSLPDELLADEPIPRAEDEEDSRTLQARVRAWLLAQSTTLPAPWDAVIRALRKKCRVVRHADSSLTLIAPPSRVEGVSTEDDGASFTETEVTLAQHSQDVKQWAESFVRRLNLPESVAQDIVLAAWLHDVGKADPRFQRWLVGGSEVRFALLNDPLAKSGQSVRDRSAREQARIQAGYPVGYRHELLSVAMVQANTNLLAKANDIDLVLHLVGSHHGWCRPFAPFRDDGDEMVAQCKLSNGPGGIEIALEATVRHRLARLDSGVGDRFWRLTEKYGWWGLAWLEAILRLADHRASEFSESAANE